MDKPGCNKCSSSRVSNAMYETGLTASVPSGRTPPMLMLVKSLYVPLSFAVTPTFGGAGWLLTLMNKQAISSLAKVSVRVPASVSFT